jgi:hypothetical protein
MSSTVALSEPKSISPRHFLSRHLALGVPIAIWALALLLIAAAAHSDGPVIVFDGQGLVVPF